MERKVYDTEYKDELEKLIAAKEPEANRNISYMFYVMAFLIFLGWISVAIGIFKADMFNTTVILIGYLVICLVCSAICNVNNGRGKWKKYLVLFSLLLVIFGINVVVGFKIMLLFAVPVIVTCRYSNILYTVVSAIFGVIFVFLCTIVNVCFSNATGVYDYNTLIDFFYGKSAVGFFALRDTDIFVNELRSNFVPNFAALLLVCFVCIVVIRYNHRLMIDVLETTRQRNQMEIDLVNSRSKVMLSQIQPHFIYNSLSAIMAIDGNPDETVDAIATFSKYLRENLDALSDNDTVPFKSELEHIEKYVAIEKLRFKQDLNVTYDIQTVDFNLPTLSTQILVENAIKHGVMEKENGGTVSVTTYEDDINYYISVKDDGVGFDVARAEQDIDSNSVGIKNVRMRLAVLCNGKLDIVSSIGKGTTALISIPKTKEQNQ